ncbi:MAG: hypothetical protein WAM71_03700 [Candidatus Korobacteraceae bacterium]
MPQFSFQAPQAVPRLPSGKFDVERHRGPSGDCDLTAIIANQDGNVVSELSVIPEAVSQMP